MPKCVIKKCRNNTLTTKKEDGVTYHRFPVHEIMRENWRKLVARERCEELYKPNKSSVICSDHFLESDLYCTTKGFNRLKKTAVPHIEFVDDSGTSQSRKSLAESSDQLKLSHVLKSSAADQKQTVLSPRTINSPVQSILSLPSGLDSILNTHKTSHFKKELTKCHRKLRFKDRQVRNLKKRNTRLSIANSSLKKILHNLETKRLVDDSLSNDIERVTA